LEQEGLYRTEHGHTRAKGEVAGRCSRFDQLLFQAAESSEEKVGLLPSLKYERDSTMVIWIDVNVVTFVLFVVLLTRNTTQEHKKA
jgi:hypothetical protein